MLSRRAIPTKPRFDFVIDRAYSLLVELGVSSLPVSHTAILEEYQDCIVCNSLSEVNELLKAQEGGSLSLPSEGKAYRRRNDGMNVIVYDDISITNPDRIRWTIMHELGHILLGHLSDFEMTALNRGGISEKEYGVLEVEANMFAAEVLAPYAVLKRITNLSKEQIRTMCWLSNDATNKRYESMFTGYHPVTSYDSILLRNFSSFLRWDAANAIYQGAQRIVRQKYSSGAYIDLSRKCSRCHSFTTDKEAKYCIYCGEKLEADDESGFKRYCYGDPDELVDAPGVRRFSFEQVTRSPDWQYTKMLRCPVCQNEEVPNYADYCPICGQQLYNICLEEKTPVSIRARYCPECGSKTSFHHAYKQHEEGIAKLRNISASEDWLEYPYWDYLILKAGQNKELAAALNHSRCFTDDDDCVQIIALSERDAGRIRKWENSILTLMNQFNAGLYTEMEVYIV